MQSEPRQYLIVGLTGGIGAGKSAAAAMFAELGRTVLSADEIAKELMASRPQLRASILRAFGPESYRDDGSLNRRHLAERIFSRPQLRRTLEGIVHPPTIQEILTRIAHLPPGRRNPYIVVEAALIYESGFDRDLDFVIVVEAEEETRIARISARDGLSVEEIRKRFRAQLPASVKAKRGDFLLRNNGSPEELRNGVAFLDRLLCQMSPPSTSNEELSTP